MYHTVVITHSCRVCVLSFVTLCRYRQKRYPKSVKVLKNYTSSPGLNAYFFNIVLFIRPVMLSECSKITIEHLHIDDMCGEIRIYGFEQHFYTRVILKVQYGSRFFTVRVLLILPNMTVRVVLIGVDYINKELCV